MSLKIGRNDPCWCGSGKKYKKCHEAFDEKMEIMKQKGYAVIDHDPVSYTHLDVYKRQCVDGPEFDGHLVDFDQAMKRSQMYKTEEGRALLKLQEGDTHHGGCGHCGGDK